MADALQSRLVQLALKHDAVVLCLTATRPEAPSLGSLVSLRAEASRRRVGEGRYACEIHVIKDKRRGPGWRWREVWRGPAGLVDIAAWPLQLLLRREPAWRHEAAAVVAADSPQATLPWVNEAARRGGNRPACVTPPALADRNLRAGTVTPAEIASSGERLHRHLLRYSPFVEPARHEPGVYWLDARGLDRLYGSVNAGPRACTSASRAVASRPASRSASPASAATVSRARRRA